MNEANQITNATALYGFIAEAAQQNRFAVTLNKRFKAEGDDAMMIPMNIRPDDFYFTLSNMKRSHLRGAVIGPEYRDQVLDVLDSASPLCEACGLCDTVTVEAGMMHGELLLPGALRTLAERSGARRIALIGSGALAAATVRAFEGFELSLFDPWVEALMALQERLGRTIDINRLALGMSVDLSGFDMLIDLAGSADLSMLSALPAANLDLMQARHPSALRQRCGELDAGYGGYDSLLDILTQTFYNYVTKENR